MKASLHGSEYTVADLTAWWTDLHLAGATGLQAVSGRTPPADGL